MFTAMQTYLKLLQVRNWFWLMLATSLLGALIAEGTLNARLLLILAANTLLISFAHLFNQIRNAPLDALDPVRAVRNPIAEGDVRIQTCRWLALAAAASALGIFFWLGWRTGVLGLLGLAVALWYSLKGSACRKPTLLDEAGHCWFLGPVLVLTAYFSLQAHVVQELLYPLLSVIFLSLYGHLSYELSSQRKDPAAAKRLSVLFMGERTAQLVLLPLLILGTLCGLISVFVQRQIPFWVALLIGILAAILIFPQFLRAHKTGDRCENTFQIHHALEKSAGIALSVYFLSPHLTSLLRLIIP